MFLHYSAKTIKGATFTKAQLKRALGKNNGPSFAFEIRIDRIVQYMNVFH